MPSAKQPHAEQPATSGELMQGQDTAPHVDTPQFDVTAPRVAGVNRGVSTVCRVLHRLVTAPRVAELLGTGPWAWTAMAPLAFLKV